MNIDNNVVYGVFKNNETNNKFVQITKKHVVLLMPLDNKLMFSTGTKSLSPPEYSIFKQS